MPRAGKLTTAVATAAVAVAMLTGCTATSAPPAAIPSLKPTPSDTPPMEADSDDCGNRAWINLDSEGASIAGHVEDRGAREFAQGTVGLGATGTVMTYTVAPGDVIGVIGERLCIANALSLSDLNHTRMIHPDQVLRLHADPELRFIPYYSPPDPPPGFLQIPYQEAIEAMGRAADAGDVDAMRGIWAETLSDMFTDPADLEAIQQALDAGDLDVLTKMFS